MDAIQTSPELAEPVLQVAVSAVADLPEGQGARSEHGLDEPGLETLEDELLLQSGWLQEVVDLLEEKRQVIFQGPPGTGKTFIARRLAKYFEEAGGGSETVQFHPSYSYEDFVEGYRPRLVEGQPGFGIVSGPLKRLAREAELDPEHKYVLVIDEINRGNVAKVFGELYFLLEYRDQEIHLQYANQDAYDDEESESGTEPTKFRLPGNLWIIGTMNTADRSIALMDSALRRRFYFVDYYPNEPPAKDLLERWLARFELPQFHWLPRVVDEANRRLNNRDAAIGPSHFLVSDPEALTEERIERIWRFGVMPYLQEQLFGERERLKEFSLESLRESLEDVPSEGDENAEFDEGSADDLDS